VHERKREIGERERERERERNKAFIKSSRANLLGTIKKSRTKQ